VRFPKPEGVNFTPIVVLDWGVTVIGKGLEVKLKSAELFPVVPML
jgi:hypothetical protein